MRTLANGSLRTSPLRLSARLVDYCFIPASANKPRRREGDEEEEDELRGPNYACEWFAVFGDERAREANCAGREQRRASKSRRQTTRSFREMVYGVSGDLKWSEGRGKWEKKGKEEEVEWYWNDAAMAWLFLEGRWDRVHAFSARSRKMFNN